MLCSSLQNEQRYINRIQRRIINRNGISINTLLERMDALVVKDDHPEMIDTDFKFK